MNEGPDLIAEGIAYKGRLFAWVFIILFLLMVSG